jgi:hypothetical protein
MYLALKVLVNGVFTVLLIPVLQTGMYLALKQMLIKAKSLVKMQGD